MSGDEWLTIGENSGPLVAARGEGEGSGRFRRLVLEFENGTLVVECDVDTDEVLARLAADAFGAELPFLGPGEIFAEATGSVVEYAWTMRNHRGYTDAIQLRLLDLGSRSESTVQLEVVASALHTSVVTHVKPFETEQLIAWWATKQSG